MTSSGGTPNVFSIPAGEPFLTSLAAAILRGDLPRSGTMPPDPVSLSDVQILLPTRRAVRSLWLKRSCRCQTACSCCRE